MKCYRCDANLGQWDAPGQKGTMQSWYRNYVVDASGRTKCADRNACRNRTLSHPPTTIDNPQEEP